MKVVTYGSGSCPATATAIENDGSLLVIVFEVDAAGPCTADMAPTTHSFSAEHVGEVIPDKAVVVFPEINEEHVVDIIRG
ncbi:hypothetical protein [Microbacterium sp. H1-D42]|uniref:hypothetical protein n=1 Tax=Microbacterium sp. H1-D42 TaxID=2925844 RepID=UPI001F531B7D|nr:hypothetical protein [Microbacterium sp. H1-D42]UNK71370.1 hypothetical protein MNR00_02635 [Microbacterium sp. H1-D42]